MTPDEIATFAALANSIGTVGLLAVVLVGLLRGVVVTRGHMEDVEAEKDKQIAILREWLKDCRNGADIPES